MDLSRIERLILANQYRILEALYPDESESLAKHREAIENGYELQYNRIFEHIYSDEDIMTKDECQEVLDILDMFSSLNRTYNELSDKSDIEKSAVQFKGFDGNNETKQMSYTRYFCSLNGGRYTDLDRGDDFNSHMPIIDVYRRMLNEWIKSEDKNNLTKDDIIRISSARKHPDSK